MRPAVRIVAGLVFVVLLVVLGINLFGDDEGTSERGPAALSESELRERVAELDQPVYWVGPRPDTAGYELATPAEGQVYVRYLTAGNEVEAAPGDLLAVGTYSLPGAGDSLSSVAAEDPARKLSSRDGYEVLAGPQSANAYVVFGDQPDYQVELYSPVPGEAAELATSGALTPVG